MPEAHFLNPVQNKEFIKELLALHNKERSKNTMGALALNMKLCVAAARHAYNMAKRDFYDHKDPVENTQCWDRMTKAGYIWCACAENIYKTPKTPLEAVNGWMKSPGHCKNILTPDYKDVGFGIAYSVDGMSQILYWVANFGTRRN